MLRAVATTRSPLELWPGPVRLLVLRVEDGEGGLVADMSSAVGSSESGPEQFAVRAGGTFAVAGRMFRVSGVHTGGQLGDRVEFEEVPAG